MRKEQNGLNEDLFSSIQNFQHEVHLFLNTKFITYWQKQLEKFRIEPNDLIAEPHYPNPNEILEAIKKYDLENKLTLLEILHVSNRYLKNEIEPKIKNNPHLHQIKTEIKELQKSIINDLAFISYRELSDLKLSQDDFHKWWSNVTATPLTKEDLEINDLHLKIADLNRDLKRFNELYFQELQTTVGYHAQLQATKKNIVDELPAITNAFSQWLKKREPKGWFPTISHDYKVVDNLYLRLPTLTEKEALTAFDNFLKLTGRLRHKISRYDENNKKSLDEIYLATKEWLEKRNHRLFPASSPKYFAIKALHQRTIKALYIHRGTNELATFLIAFEYKLKSIPTQFRTEGIKQMLRIFELKEDALRDKIQPDPVKTFHALQRIGHERTHGFFHRYHTTLYRISKKFGHKFGRQDWVSNLYQKIDNAEILSSHHSDNNLTSLQTYIEKNLEKNFSDENPGIRLEP